MKYVYIFTFIVIVMIAKVYIYISFVPLTKSKIIVGYTFYYLYSPIRKRCPIYFIVDSHTQQKKHIHIQFDILEFRKKVEKGVTIVAVKLILTTRKRLYWQYYK